MTAEHDISVNVHVFEREHLSARGCEVLETPTGQEILGFCNGEGDLLRYTVFQLQCRTHNLTSTDYIKDFGGKIQVSSLRPTQP